jgi:hypothetical protein
VGCADRQRHFQLGRLSFRRVVPRDAVAGTPADYGEQDLTNTIAMLERVCTVDEIVAEWAA